MKKFSFFILIFICSFSHSQEKGDTIKFDSDKLLAEMSEGVCKCIDSIPANALKDAVAFRINTCIDEKATAYQMGVKLASIDLSQKEINIEIATDKNSNVYKKYYYEMESYLMTNCKALKFRLSHDDSKRQHSMSENKEALKFYNEGVEATQKEDYKKAISLFKKAVKVDPNFAFAYDNMGICYRKLDEFDKAIDAYEQSLKIDPNGTMPLQNIAVAYQYKKQYDKAIKSYERLADIDPENPEIFYGMGHTYISYMKEYEKGLDAVCKAYAIYVAKKSPYRSDAEQLIGVAYSEMKKQGKEAKFNEILAQHNISTE